MNHPFTPTYILMAKAAEEIQAIEYDLDGNYLYCETYQEVWIYPHFPDAEADVDTHSIDPWLPRLDQLLGMLGDFKDFDQAMEKQADGHPENGGYYAKVYGITEWHEIALAVVMREKYGKTWDGKEWVKT
jgi:hypothetical protein